MSGALQPLRNAYLETDLAMVDKQLSGVWGTSTRFGLGFLAAGDQATMRSYIGASGSGTVTSVAVSGANGIVVGGSPITGAGTIALSLGAITPSSVAASGAVTGSNLSGTNTGDQTITLTGNVTGSGAGSFAATIANDAVTYAKMQNVSATSRVLGRKTAGAGDPEELTISEVLDFVGSATEGDILYRDSSIWTVLPAGSEGQVLTSHGVGTRPTWETLH